MVAAVKASATESPPEILGALLFRFGTVCAVREDEKSAAENVKFSFSRSTTKSRVRCWSLAARSEAGAPHVLGASGVE